MSCVFCAIIEGKEPANIRYEDDDVVVFDNKLKWAPVMLVVVRKQHLSQEEFWRDMSKVGKVAVEMGKQYCPGGFRLLSNFGPDAMQSQEHGHIHVIGGTFLGPYA
ncbi:MAG: HIT family protein [Dehalococcoidia bacterium]